MQLKVRALKYIKEYQQELKLIKGKVRKKEFANGTLHITTTNFNSSLEIVTKVFYKDEIIPGLVVDSFTSNIYAYVNTHRSAKRIHVVRNIPHMGNINEVLKKWYVSVCNNDSEYSVVLYDYKENWIELTEKLYRKTVRSRDRNSHAAKNLLTT